MKHNIFFKAVAFLLCAVSLLGIVGTGLGILVLTETGLYNKTVDQLMQEQLQREASALAQTLAARYASTELGGVPNYMVTDRYPVQSYGYLSGVYGYTIADEEGNVVASVDPTDPEAATVYTFPVTGQYIHLVSLMTEAEKFPAYEGDPSGYTNAVLGEDLYLYEAVPPEGATVNQVFFTCADGDYFEYADEALGSVYYSRQGQLICMFSDPGLGLPVNTDIVSITMASYGELLYEASSPSGVGYFTGAPGGMGMMFVSTVASQPEETTPPTVPETVAETVPETTVPETVPETTVPETTVPEIVFTVENNVPTEHFIEVVELSVTLTDGSEIYHEDEYGIGRVRTDSQGRVAFTSYDDWDTDTGDVSYIIMLDDDGETIFEASCEEGIGEFFYDDDNRVCYVSAIPEPPVVETEPETVPTTVPETVPETTMETVAETQPEETEPPVTQPVIINGKPLRDYEINTTSYYDYETQQTMYAEFVYTPMPGYTVDLYLTEDSFFNAQIYDIYRMVRSVRSYLLPIMGVCILLFLLTGFYLVCAAGHTPKSDSIQAGGLNRIPLDLYLLILLIGIPCLCIGATEGGMYLMQENISVGIACAAALSFAASVLAVGFLMALVAQIKTPGGFWWHNTLCGHFIRLCFRLGRWLELKGRETYIPFFSRLVQKIWLLVCTSLVWLYRNTEKGLLWTGRTLGRLLRWLKDVLHRFLSLLPLTWQWLAMGFLLLLMMALIFATNGEELLAFLCMFGSISLIVYGAHCFGTLLDSTKKMRKGNLNIKVDDSMMVGSFKEFAGELNELAGVAVVAAQKQLNSERMKSELITNVSHDIKTPLTSIINYVDLLQKPHTPEEGEQYLEVLDRQSQQLKKLLEDLMDMSKASTGNMNVEITRVDAVESVNQALGEFADKLERARLVPVFRHTESHVPMMADGRLVWRVLNNLLGNAVKYAMPGTRLYVDLMTLDETVVLSLKNISREELNIDADELMERFVRGDGSRNTEGSGLGLNIAKSLMELQKGQMQLLVDGDLFKVTLIFPAK